VHRAISMCHPVGGQVPLDRYKPQTLIPHMRELTSGKHVGYEPDELDAADQPDGGAGEVSLVPHVDVDLADCRGGWGGAVVRSEPGVVSRDKAGIHDRNERRRGIDR
jgi:hypothetical protein